MPRRVSTKISAHITSALIAGAYATAQRRHFAAWEGDLSGVSPDTLIAMMILPTLLFAAIFGAGHVMIRRLINGSRSVYSGLGAVALFAASAATMPHDLIEAAQSEGIVSVLVLLSLGVGSLIGFLHFRSSGFEHDEDEVEQLEAAVSSPAVATTQASKTQAHPARSQQAAQMDTVQSVTSPAPQPTAQAFTARTETGKIETQSTTFFDGPLQVITSKNALFAGAVAGGLAHFGYMGLFFLGGSDFVSDYGSNPFEGFTPLEFLSRMVFGMLFSQIVCLILLTPSVYGLHKLLASRNRTDMRSYLIAGALAPLALGLLMFGFGIMLTHWLIVPLAVAMGVYRHLAGLEPAALPEDIEVSDRRTLVGHDHVRRRVHRVVG